MVPYNAILYPAGTVFDYWTIINETPKRKRGYYWKCRCICGKVRWVHSTRLRKGCSKSCGCKAPATRRGPDNCNWRGGRIVHPAGYILLREPNHPNANKADYVLESVKVMSAALGRPIRKGEIIHHKNGVRADNKLGNLQLCVKRKHPTGQLVTDVAAWCVKFLKQYKGDLAMLQEIESGNMLA